MAGRTWRAAEAHARFSELIEKAEGEGPQYVTDGDRHVVVVSEATWLAVQGNKPEAGKPWYHPKYGVLSRDEVETLFARDPDPGRVVEL